MIESSRRQFVIQSASALCLAATRSTWATSRATSEPWSADQLIEPTHTLLGSIRAPVLDPFLADWPVTGERRPVVPSAIPVLSLLPKIKTEAPGFSHELVNDIVRAAPSMAWRQTYTVADVGAAFLQNYGWSEIVGTSGPLPGEHVACGFLILGPGTHYPLHQHEAEEIYIPLSGTASWLQGDGAWQKLAPGTVIHHSSNEPHAMRTGKQPMLGLYLWRSTDLRQKAHFVR
jgi:quercetin dioxygenase-like cupin family protein